MARRVYFNTSALNRPFDDQAQIRIRLEAEAVETSFGRSERGGSSGSHLTSSCSR